MLNHVTIGVAELGRAIKFYDSLLGVIGAKELWSTQAMKMYGTAPDVPRVAICTPFNGEPQHPGNGTMIAFKGGSKEGVDQLYTKAIELGATDEGKPGERRKPLVQFALRCLEPPFCRYFTLSIGMDDMQKDM